MTHNGVMVTIVQEIVKYANIERRTGSKTMDECIKREKVIKAIESVPDGNWKSARYVKEVKAIPAADVVPASDFRDCRNELCLKCGAYTQKHLGACDGCRWRTYDA